MKVCEILEIIPRGTVVRVLQTPIARFDSSHEPVLRQYAEVTDLKTSNQNYLEFEAVKLAQDCGIMTITCTANAEQEGATIAAFYGGI